MSTVVGYDRGFTSDSLMRDLQVRRTAGGWRFHVFGEHMRDRILHWISTFYAPRSEGRKFRCLIRTVRGEFRETGTYIAFEDLRAGTIPAPERLAMLPDLHRGALGTQLSPRPPPLASGSLAGASASQLEISASTNSLSLAQQHTMPDDWVVVDIVTTSYRHVPTGRSFKAPLRVVVRNSRGEVDYDRFVNLEVANEVQWVPNAEDQRARTQDTLLIDYSAAWRELH